MSAAGAGDGPAYVGVIGAARCSAAEHELAYAVGGELARRGAPLATSGSGAPGGREPVAASEPLQAVTLALSLGRVSGQRDLL